MLRVLLLVVCLFASQSVWALNKTQKWALVYASQVGAPDHLEILEPAIIWEESQACRYQVNPEDPSYGCGGLLVSTASALAGRIVTAKELMTNNRLNIQLSEKYLAACVKNFGLTRGLICYNRGPDAAKSMSEKTASTDFYVLAVRGRVKEIKSFPVSTE